MSLPISPVRSVIIGFMYGCSDVGCVYIYNRYILLKNPPLYCYVMTFFISHYNHCLVYLAWFRCSYPCGTLQSEPLACWIRRYGKEPVEGRSPWVTSQGLSTPTWGPCEGWSPQDLSVINCLDTLCFWEVREVFHLLRLWNVTSVPWTVGYFSATTRAPTEGPCLGCYLASGLWHFLSFLFGVTFFHMFPSWCCLQVSQHGVAVRSGCEFQLFQVVPL